MSLNSSVARNSCRVAGDFRQNDVVNMNGTCPNKKMKHLFPWWWETVDEWTTQRIHVWYITYIYHKMSGIATWNIPFETSNRKRMVQIMLRSSAGNSTVGVRIHQGRTKHVHFWQTHLVFGSMASWANATPMWVFPFNGGTPNLHPKMIEFLVGKPMVVGETHQFRKPPI